MAAVFQRQGRVEAHGAVRARRHAAAAVILGPAHPPRPQPRQQLPARHSAVLRYGHQDRDVVTGLDE